MSAFFFFFPHKNGYLQEWYSESLFSRACTNGQSDQIQRQLHANNTLIQNIHWLHKISHNLYFVSLAQSAGAAEYTVSLQGGKTPLTSGVVG